MDVKASLLADRRFRPESFFVGRTEGAGVVRDLFGRLARRCEIVTEGARQAAYGALQLEETFTYDDGEVDVWRWVMTTGGDGRYMASEYIAGSGIVGQNVGGDYVLAFNRAAGRARGWTTPHYVSRLTLLSAETALKTVRISVLGAPVATLTGFHRRLSD